MRRPFKTQKSCMRWVNDVGLEQRLDTDGSLERIPAIAGMLIVQFLVKTLCTVLESDNEKAINMYDAICNSLHQMNLIDTIYETREDLASHWNHKPINLQIWGILRNLPFFKHEPTITITLLVESLVQLLWRAVTPSFRKTMYSPRKICRFLHFKKIINKAYIMNEYEMMRDEYMRNICNIFCVVRGGRIPGEMEPIWQLTEHFCSQPLRYTKEFHEFTLIAAGAFGEVFKVKHKLDGAASAIKKIVLDNEWKSVGTVLMESTTMARLDHPNIVPYKAAWIESQVVPYGQDEDLESIITEDDRTVSSLCSYKSNISEFVQFKKGSNTQTLSKCSNATLCSKTNQPSYKLEMTLFIQMSFCQMTLKDYLEKRNGEALQDDVMDVTKDIFMQLLEALSYLRSEKIIHHDLKPANIFVNRDGNGRRNVRVGDFGLSCVSQKGHTGEGFGTRGYAAPEQLEGKCTTKSDMYSLGVILLQLLIPFGTEQELAHTIKDIHKGNLPESINDSFRTLLKCLLAHSPKQRPGVTKVMIWMKKMNNCTECDCQQRLRERDIVIKKLKAQLAAKDKQIKKLETEKQHESIHIPFSYRGLLQKLTLRHRQETADAYL